MPRRTKRPKKRVRISEINPDYLEDEIFETVVVEKTEPRPTIRYRRIAPIKEPDCWSRVLGALIVVIAIAALALAVVVAIKK